MKGIKEVGNIARIDLYRDRKSGIPEVVLAEGKEPFWIARILVQMVQEKGIALATRLRRQDFKKVNSILQKKIQGCLLKYYEKAGMIMLRKKAYKIAKKKGKIGLLSAGTTDIPVAEEARVTLELLGYEAIPAYDVGIAGLHRLYAPLERMLKEKVCAIIVVAGMEGALPTVVKGLVDVPVIGVPVSTGYGYGGKGQAALMTMLQSCSPGVMVVNIDNGFGAGVAASLIARQCNR